jgi:predicted 3-demethylubiquinone-9 3-methyltransferase (glyoxalase superfamily)
MAGYAVCIDGNDYCPYLKKSQRVMEAMLQMKKIDIEKLDQACLQ